MPAASPPGSARLLALAVRALGPIDTLLVMAEAEDRWGDSRRPVDLLDNVEQIAGELPQPYERMRRRCRDTIGTP